MIVGYFLLVFFAIEIALICIVEKQRLSFPWLITKRDEKPNISHSVIDKFIKKSHDPYLGWVRRPNSQGVESGKFGDVTYRIDSNGSRALKTPYIPKIAAFGDSYVFCRQVNDEDTWEAKCANEHKIGMLNFGVGNYGADQALLRYERTKLPDTVTHVILGFVPETICRIQSRWKHYLEFGNTLAFKPKFVISDNGRLNILENVMRSKSDFTKLESYLPEIQDSDPLYQKKFRALQFRFPYTFSLLRNPSWGGRLIPAIALRSLTRLARIKKCSIESLPFRLVMQNNLKAAHAMYSKQEEKDLLVAILHRFVEQAKLRNHKPLILVMPQLMDIQYATKKPDYSTFFDSLSSELPVLDLTGAFLSRGLQGCYIDDEFGGHFSAKGNAVVADELARHFRNDVKFM